MVTRVDPLIRTLASMTRAYQSLACLGTLGKIFTQILPRIPRCQVWILPWVPSFQKFEEKSKIRLFWILVHSPCPFRMVFLPVFNFAISMNNYCNSSEYNYRGMRIIILQLLWIKVFYLYCITNFENGENRDFFHLNFIILSKTVNTI